MSKPKKSGLSQRYHDHADSKLITVRQNSYYSNFYEYYASAIASIFDVQAGVKEVPSPLLQMIMRPAGDRISILFVTGAVTPTESGSHRVAKPEATNDEAFAELFNGFFGLSRQEPSVRLSKLDEGVYEFEIGEPREALSLLKNFLDTYQVKCCDPRPREIISTRGPATPMDADLLNSVINYIPQQAFLSAASAQAAGKFLFLGRNGYPFSMNYMEALLEQAEGGGLKASLPSHLESYRQH